MSNLLAGIMWFICIWKSQRISWVSFSIGCSFEDLLRAWLIMTDGKRESRKSMLAVHLDELCDHTYLGLCMRKNVRIMRVIGMCCLIYLAYKASSAKSIWCVRHLLSDLFSTQDICILIYLAHEASAVWSVWCTRHLLSDLFGTRSICCLICLVHEACAVHTMSLRYK